MNNVAVTAAVATAAGAIAFGAGTQVPTESTTEPSCTKVPLAVVVDLRADHANIIQHVQDAVFLAGKPRILHIDRLGAATRRKLSLSGFPTKPGLDRDEYPPAIATEGGAGAHIRYIPAAENRSAGSVMGNQLRPFCNSQAFIIEP